MASTPTPDAPPGDRHARRASLAVPALTFLAGAVVGGVLVAVGAPGGEGVVDAAGEAASPTPTATATGTDDGDDLEEGGSAPSDPDDASTAVPASCLEAAELSEQLLSLTRRAASAAAELDARLLETLVDEAEDVDPALRAAAADCQELAAGAGG